MNDTAGRSDSTDGSQSIEISKNPINRFEQDESPFAVNRKPELGVTWDKPGKLLLFYFFRSILIIASPLASSYSSDKRVNLPQEKGQLI